jgi:hypothetical protein
MRTILFTNARDEKNIMEWIAHHLNIGFSHIYIFDHKSIIPIKDITKYISPKKLTVNRIDCDIIKTILIKMAINYAKRNKYDWMLYLDCDEFLVLNNHTTISSMIEQYNNYNMVGLNWLLFGSNNKDTFDGTIISNFTMCDNVLNRHIKTLLNIKKIGNMPIAVKNPHVYIIFDMSKSVGIDMIKLDRIRPQFHTVNMDIQVVNAYIAHYIYQSYETYLQRKIFLPADDTFKFRHAISKEIFHTKYNIIENKYITEKYDNINRQLMLKFSQPTQIPI